MNIFVCGNDSTQGTGIKVIFEELSPAISTWRVRSTLGSNCIPAQQWLRRDWLFYYVEKQNTYLVALKTLLSQGEYNFKFLNVGQISWYTGGIKTEQVEEHLDSIGWVMGLGPHCPPQNLCLRHVSTMALEKLSFLWE